MYEHIKLDRSPMFCDRFGSFSWFFMVFSSWPGTRAHTLSTQMFILFIFRFICLFFLGGGHGRSRRIIRICARVFFFLSCIYFFSRFIYLIYGNVFPSSDVRLFLLLLVLLLFADDHCGETVHIECVCMHANRILTRPDWAYYVSLLWAIFVFYWAFSQLLNVAKY